MQEGSMVDRTAALLMDFRLPVQISLGRTKLLLGQLLDLTPGTLVELDCPADGDVEIIVNQRVIARGEVVDCDGNYGVRIRSLEPSVAADDPVAELQPQPEGT